MTRTIFLAGRGERERRGEERGFEVKGENVESTPEVLFVCVHNAGRSIAASVLLRHHASGQVRVSSAGSQPGTEINSVVAQVLSERGLDASQEFPKPISEASTAMADVVITMGCGDECVFYPGKVYLDWEVEDPAGKPIEAVRPIVDEIEARVLGFLNNLDTILR